MTGVFVRSKKKDGWTKAFSFRDKTHARTVPFFFFSLLPLSHSYRRSASPKLCLTKTENKIVKTKMSSGFNLEDVKDHNFYQILGVDSNADEVTIKKAYRKKVLQCHPDKCPENPNAVELFHMITKACVILLDAETRNFYNETLKVGWPNRTV